jgi:hypothetical protein
MQEQNKPSGGESSEHALLGLHAFRSGPVSDQDGHKDRCAHLTDEADLLC